MQICTDLHEPESCDDSKYDIMNHYYILWKRTKFLESSQEAHISTSQELLKFLVWFSVVHSATFADISQSSIGLAQEKSHQKPPTAKRQ